MDDRIVCCESCQAVDVLWPGIQQARSILQHRPPNAETVALALRALEGIKAGGLVAQDPKEAN